jgi:hypothetical protein
MLGSTWRVRHWDAGLRKQPMRAFCHICQWVELKCGGICGHPYFLGLVFVFPWSASHDISERSAVHKSDRVTACKKVRHWLRRRSLLGSKLLSANASIIKISFVVSGSSRGYVLWIDRSWSWQNCKRGLSQHVVIHTCDLCICQVPLMLLIPSSRRNCSVIAVVRFSVIDGLQASRRRRSIFLRFCL